MAFDPEQWPHGLRCMDCDREFVEGQPVAERLTAMTEHQGEPAAVVDIVCVSCALGELHAVR